MYFLNGICFVHVKNLLEIVRRTLVWSPAARRISEETDYNFLILFSAAVICVDTYSLYCANDIPDGSTQSKCLVKASNRFQSLLLMGDRVKLLLLAFHTDD